MCSLKKRKLLKEENESTIGKAAQCTAQISELERAMISMVLLLIFIGKFLLFFKGHMVSLYFHWCLCFQIMAIS